MAAFSMHRLPFVEDCVHLPVIGSTNDYAKSLSRYPHRGMLVIVADRQTAGRGQKGNSFFSDAEGGLWMTVVCPIDDLSSHFRYNRAMIMAVFDAIAAGAALCAAGSPLAIKWPNDLYWSGRKLCGMLLETASAAPRHLIIGVGIDVNIPRDAFPEDLRTAATSLSIETGRAWDIPRLMEAILIRFHDNLDIDEADIHGWYRQRLYRVGAAVRAGAVEGTLRDVGIDGRLCVKAQSGMEYISSGPVHFVEDHADR